jgi:lysozyme family protein
MRTFENDYCPVILRNEGGFQNNPKDSGNYRPDGTLVGTKFGICAKEYPSLDIINLTQEQAVDIYRMDYWTPLNIDDLENDLLKLHIFDEAVNAGKHEAIVLLQHILGVGADGACGKITITAANDYEDQNDLAAKYIQGRIDYYNWLATVKPQDKVFLSDWIYRVQHTNFLT